MKGNFAVNNGSEAYMREASLNFLTKSDKAGLVLILANGITSKKGRCSNNRSAGPPILLNTLSYVF